MNNSIDNAEYNLTKLENDPLQRMNEILEEYAELNCLMFGDDRFHGIEEYSDWSL